MFMEDKRNLNKLNKINSNINYAITMTDECSCSCGCYCGTDNSDSASEYAAARNVSSINSSR